jgi:hydroxyacylglutathione hydrolase
MQRLPLALPAALFFALASCDSGPADPPFTGGFGGSAGDAGAGGGPGGSAGAADAGAGGGSAGQTMGGASGAGGAGGAGGATPGPPANRGFPSTWPDGLACADEPDVTVWGYDDDTFILRQSLCSNFEGPFLYLLFGEDKAFLQDTGTGDVDIAGAVGAVIADWLAKKGKASIDLVVTHSHGHGDHVGGDGQFDATPGATVVGPSSSEVQTFFGIADWPAQIVPFELGGRTLEIIPIPGHQSAHVAVYDRSRGLLLTGDTLYPGRLYVDDWDAYGQSLQRLADFTAAAEHPVTWVLGTHIEMTTTPGSDYAMGADEHPNEHPLQLTKDTLSELHEAVKALGATPQYQEHDDFIIYPLLSAAVASARGAVGREGAGQRDQAFGLLAPRFRGPFRPPGGGAVQKTGAPGAAGVHEELP